MAKSFAWLESGGKKIPIAAFEIKVGEPACGPMPAFPVSGSFTTKLYWTLATTAYFEAVFAGLEARRWEGWITRQFRGQPGMRFADLMRGVGRN